MSPYLFILAPEPLAISMRSNAKIKRIEVNGKSQTTGQFAGDTVLQSLLYSKDNLAETFSLFQNFVKVWGLKVNLDKTNLFQIGTLQYCNNCLYNDINVKMVAFQRYSFRYHYFKPDRSNAEELLQPNERFLLDSGCKETWPYIVKLRLLNVLLYHNWFIHSQFCLV